MNTGAVFTRIFIAILMLPVLLAAGCGGGSDSSSGGGDTTSGESFQVLGNVSGLTGSGLVLQNNGTDDVAISTDGSFSFTTEVSDGNSYKVTVATQPATPDQYCNVYNSAGTVSGADISDVSVQCFNANYSVVDTNQSRCYNSTTGVEETCNGTGYDADYSGLQADYSLSSDGSIVTDNNTGLVWTQTPDLDGNGSVNSSDKLTQPNAVSYCDSLALGGFDWRLPNIKELYSLMQFSGTDPSGYSGSDTSVTTPFIDSVFTPGFGDTSASERLIDGQYATTSLYVSPLGTMGGNATMFGVNFVDGRIKGYPYDEPANDPKTYYVHCVSGNTSYGVNDFSDNGDGTISDQASGLEWQQDDYQSTDFEDALAYCEAATTGGHEDWRLPNIKELHSIVDYTRAPDYTTSAAIDPLFNVTSITNEGGATDWGFYWASTTHANYLGSGGNGTYISFGRALGYFEQTPGAGYSLSDVHGAGAQRSNGKQSIIGDADGSADLGSGTFYYHGPQGDILRLGNMVRCVR